MKTWTDKEQIAVSAHGDYVTNTTILGYYKQSALFRHYWCLSCACQLFTRPERAELTPIHPDYVQNKQKNVRCVLCGKWI